MTSQEGLRGLEQARRHPTSRGGEAVVHSGIVNYVIILNCPLENLKYIYQEGRIKNIICCYLLHYLFLARALCPLVLISYQQS